MKTIKTILQGMQCAHTPTKRLLIFCVVYIGAMLFAAACLFMLAGRGVNYYSAIQWTNDLIAGIRPCAGIGALGALLIEGILHTT